MQQPISRRGVYGPSMSAVVNGEMLEVSSVQVDRSLPDPLVGGSLTAASASFTAVEGADVARTVATPWDAGSSWPPVPESPVSVSMDTGAGPVSLLQGGRVTAASGGTSGREVGVEAADRYESLDRTISWDGMADAMPSPAEAVVARYVGLQSVAVTDRILRHCGWYSTPPRIAWSVLSVPAQGTMWPEVGTLDTSASSTGGYPGFLNSPWGVGVSDTDSTYFLAGGGYTIKQRGSLEFTAMSATRAGEGSSRIDVLSNTGTLMARMLWSETTVYLVLRNSAGTMTNVLSRSRADGFLYASVTYVSDTSVAVSLTSGGSTVTGTATVDSVLTTAPVRSARIVSDSVSSGFQVAMPAARGELDGWTPNAVLYPRSSGRNTLRVLPPVEGENCADLLAAQCEAECGTYWIDETGVLRWWDLARLDARSSVATLSSDDDIAESGFTWSHEMSQVKSRASVKWREPLRDWSWRTTVDLHQGSGQSIQPNTASAADPSEDWVNVPDDEVWLGVDTFLDRVGDEDSIDNFNLGIGSFYGGVIPGSGETPDVWVQNSDGSLIKTITRVTDRAFKVSTIWTGSKTAVEKTVGPESSSPLWYRRRDFDLPVIRGKAKFSFADRFTYSAQNGPATAPEHTIDAGWWIQRPEQAQYTADYAGARLTVAQPVLSSVALIPFPGLQLGDVVEVQDTAVTRLTVRGVVVEDSRSIDADMGMSHAVAIRPTFITRNGVTWQEWATAARPKTWAQWSTNQSSTWGAWGTAPLLKEDVI